MGVRISPLVPKVKKNSIMKIVDYSKEAYTELVEKVTWPGWSNLQSSAIVVMVASMIFAIVIWLMDFAFGKSMNFIYNLLY